MKIIKCYRCDGTGMEDLEYYEQCVECNNPNININHSRYECMENCEYIRESSLSYMRVSCEICGGDGYISWIDDMFRK